MEVVKVFNHGGEAQFPCKESFEAAAEAIRLGVFTRPSAAPWYRWHSDQYWSEYIVQIIDLAEWRAYKEAKAKAKREAKKDAILSTMAIIGGMVSFIGVPAEDGMYFGYFWKFCLWAIENGYHF